MPKSADKTCAIEELKTAYGFLGMDLGILPSYVAVVWRDGNGFVSSVIYEPRQSRGYGLPRVSAEAAVRIVRRLSLGHTLLSRSKKLPCRTGAGPCRVSAEEQACLRVPARFSAEELCVRLTAMGWTGNPFGASYTEKGR